MALAAMGLQFCYVAVGNQHHSQAIPSLLFSHTLVVPDSESNSFDFCDLPHAWKVAPFWLIVVFGTPGPQGPQDQNHLLSSVERIACNANVARQSLGLPCPVLGIVESASVDPRWVDSVSPNMVPLLPGPFRTEAAEFGHVDDPKLWSCFANQPLLHPMAHVQMPNVRVELTLQAVALKFQGKQCPKTVFFQDGFVKSSSKLFAPLLQHGLAQVPAPMLQKQGGQRQATLAELAHMYCIPAALAAVVPPSIIRSATHLPSLAMVVCILLKSLHCDKQVVPFPWYEPQEDKLRQLVAGTVFQPGLCDSFPGTLTAAEVADRALHRCSLEGVYFSRSASDLRSALARVPLAALQLFWVHAQLMGLPGHVQGPDWAQQKAPSASALAIGSQRGSGLSRFALCPLHPSGLSKEQHIAASAQVASPFASACILDEDLQFVCQLLATYGPYVRQWRLDQLKIMRKLAKVLQPWEAECAGCMPPSVQRVAAAKKPMFMLVCSILLRWPDETNALRYVTGYRIVGDIECSGLFRPLDVDRSQSTGTDVLFGKPAVHNLWAMRQRVKPGQHDAELASMTRQEILDGFAEGVFTQDELDERFGVGLRRPLERFIHVQSCGKLRCIDSGKKPGHNAASRESETIYTTTVDVVPVVVRRAWEMIWQFWAADSSCLPEWCDFVLGTEDMKNAYRQCPVHPQHRSCSTIAFWDHEVNDIRFVVLNGLPFGLSSSVLNFNRTPALLTAVARRFCGCAVAHFFDDSGIVDLSCSNGLAQAIVREVYALAGAHLDPAKSQSPAGCRTFLGLSVNVALAATAGVVEVDLKPGFRETIKAEIESVLESSTLTSGQAAKLRGKFGWAASGTYGKCGRGGQAPLVQRQYFDHSDFLTSSLRDALNFHLLLATFVGPKQIAVFNEPMPPIRIYSDASYEPEADVVAGIGFVLFDAASSRPPIGMAASLDPEVLQLFQQRHQQITPCEAILSVIVPHNLGPYMGGRDVVWYMDNQAACQILTVGSSSQSDLCFIASLAHLLFARLNCRIFGEYIASDANPSDGLSRKGLLDEWTQLQGWSLSPAHIPDLLQVAAVSLSAALQLIS